jgi:hypothetical protein
VVSAKRQLFVQSPSFSVSVAAGVGVPSRGMSVADRGYHPYLQFPWSRSIAEDWSVNGMVTVTWSTVAKSILEPTLVIEHEFGRGDLFAEYIGDYTGHHRASQVIDGGGGWHFTSTQQLDFHVGIGLTRSSVHHYVGVGYSLRVDGLFGRHHGGESPRDAVSGPNGQ